MLQCIELILEEGDVELAIVIWSYLNKLGDQEGSVTIFILPHTVLIPAEKFHNGLEKVRPDITNSIGRQISCQEIPLTYCSISTPCCSCRRCRRRT